MQQEVSPKNPSLISAQAPSLSQVGAPMGTTIGGTLLSVGTAQVNIKNTSQPTLQLPQNSPQNSNEQMLLLHELRLAHLLCEKCELAQGREAFFRALELARTLKNRPAVIEAIGGLLRLAGEALDPEAMDKWESELDLEMEACLDDPKFGFIPAYAWYVKGAKARHQGEPDTAAKLFLKFLAESRRHPKGASFGLQLSKEDLVARAWVMLAVTSVARGRMSRARWIISRLLSQFETKRLSSINGTAYLTLGRIAELEGSLHQAQHWYQKAHAEFLGERNWYYHLHVLLGYARVAAKQQNYAAAYGYLDLIDKAASGPEFGLLRGNMETERSMIEKDSVDLVIDVKRGIVRTREHGPISIRKQYVLLGILEALSEVHVSKSANGSSMASKGLSKAELIDRVWHEVYRPEAHDNKLYYNINRLRRLIEPDMKRPKYLQNWKEGYRLGPELRVQFIGEHTNVILGGKGNRL